MAERQIRRLADLAKLACCLLSACNSMDERGPKGSALVIPVDVRAAQQALHTPPAISGGTLAATEDGRFAVAADPDRDRISIIELANSNVRQIPLNAADEPGRVVALPRDPAIAPTLVGGRGGCDAVG